MKRAITIVLVILLALSMIGALLPGLVGGTF
jgi:hypothetical protein